MDMFFDTFTVGENPYGVKFYIYERRTIFTTLTERRRKEKQERKLKEKKEKEERGSTSGGQEVKEIHVELR
jgi:hypothetical protein